MNARKVPVRRNTDIHGKPVHRTPEEYPYSYDHIAVFKTTAFKDTTDTVYSDRMWQWSPEKFEACHVRAFDKGGQFFDSRKPEKVEKFLQYYFGINLDLTGIEEGCNFGNGNPYWVFYFKRNEEFRDNHLELTDEDRKALERKKELSQQSSEFFAQFS
jgi:hypothetical protein